MAGTSDLSRTEISACFIVIAAPRPALLGQSLADLFLRKCDLWLQIFGQRDALERWPADAIGQHLHLRFRDQGLRHKSLGKKCQDAVKENGKR